MLNHYKRGSSDAASDTAITVKVTLTGDPASADKFTVVDNDVNLTAGNKSEQVLTEPLIMEENEVLQVTSCRWSK